MSDGALFDLLDVAPTWEPIYNSGSGAQGQLCRDCGQPKSWGMGGARPGLGLFQLCEDCGALDGWNERADGAENCSRWGIRTAPADHERMVRERELRRTSHRRRSGSESAHSDAYELAERADSAC